MLKKWKNKKKLGYSKIKQAEVYELKLAELCLLRCLEHVFDPFSVIFSHFLSFFLMMTLCHFWSFLIISSPIHFFSDVYSHFHSIMSFSIILSHFVSFLVILSFFLKMTQSHVLSFLSILKVEQLILKYHINFRTYIWSF